MPNALQVACKREVVGGRVENLAQRDSPGQTVDEVALAVPALGRHRVPERAFPKGVANLSPRFRTVRLLPRDLFGLRLASHLGRAPGARHRRVRLAIRAKP